MKIQNKGVTQGDAKNANAQNEAQGNSSAKDIRTCINNRILQKDSKYNNLQISIEKLKRATRYFKDLSSEYDDLNTRVHELVKSGNYTQESLNAIVNETNEIMNLVDEICEKVPSKYFESKY